MALWGKKNLHLYIFLSFSTQNLWAFEYESLYFLKTVALSFSFIDFTHREVGGVDGMGGGEFPSLPAHMFSRKSHTWCGRAYAQAKLILPSFVLRLRIECVQSMLMRFSPLFSPVLLHSHHLQRYQLGAERRWSQGLQ